MPNIQFYIDLGFSVAIAALFMFLIIYKVKKKFVWLTFGIELVLMIIFGFTGLTISTLIVLGIFIVTGGLVVFVNLGELRTYFSNSISHARVNSKELSQVSREKLAKNITTAVKWLSDTRTGALITFERSDSLNKYIDSGTIINCPVTPEIIETIFYEGTRLHDGAIIIRGNIIVAASVFFTATTRNLVGKYGARHRAALGVSEATDSITIVVSEETGRISIAYAGILESVKYDEFEKVFSTFMLSPSIESKKKDIDSL